MPEYRFVCEQCGQTGEYHGARVTAESKGYVHAFTSHGGEVEIETESRVEAERGGVDA